MEDQVEPVASQVKGKRRPKRSLLSKPSASDDEKVVSELISVVKCSLASVVRHKALRPLLEKVAVVTNQMRKRVSMLAKELLLAKLKAGEDLPPLDQSFYSALYTSLRNGKWKHGHDAVLARHRAPDPELKSVICQTMTLVARKLAAELDTHYRMHYEKFYRRWKRVFLSQVDDDDKSERPKAKAKAARKEDPRYFLDPGDKETKLNKLVKAAWAMRAELEARQVRGFALFPEAETKVAYVTLDVTCVARLYRSLYPESFQIPGKHPGTTKQKPDNDVAMEHGPEIFAELFDLPRIRRLRRTHHHFRYSLQTDGMGVALSFGRWVESTRKLGDDTVGKPSARKRRKTESKKKKKKKASSSGAPVKRDVVDLVPGYAYHAPNKTLDSLASLQGTTVRCVDPGVRRTYTSVDLLTGDIDVRSSVKSMRSRTWQRRTRAQEHGAQMKRWHDAELGEVQRRLNATPFRTSADVSRYRQYVDATLAHWDALWAFATQRKLRKCRFRANIDAQGTLGRAVNELCAPRTGDRRTLLVYGNGASTNLFGKTKKNVKGPARKLFDTAVRHKKAVCVWADEFRTSKLGVDGRRPVHPRETRADRIRPSPCKASAHALDAPGCRCFCSHGGGCDAKRTQRYWCADHVKPQLQYDVCYSNQSTPQGQHQHRMWNRDVIGALNIGCLFLAQCLGLDLALWQRGTTDDSDGAKSVLTSPLSWADIFGCGEHRLPFSLPSTLPSTRRSKRAGLRGGL